MGERSYATNDGERRFAPGDRVLFLENNRDLGGKNGMLGTVQEAEEGRLVARLDTARGPGLGREISASTVDYAAIDHGYATTIHKSQGATVDRAYVLSSGGMDRHLTYVAMTRHREAATLYAGRDEFGDLQGLSERLGRAGLKETTLDYARDFAEQRGLADRLGVSSEIVVPGHVENQMQGRDERGLAERENASTAPQQPGPQPMDIEGALNRAREAFHAASKPPEREAEQQQPVERVSTMDVETALNAARDAYKVEVAAQQAMEAYRTEEARLQAEHERLAEAQRLEAERVARDRDEDREYHGQSM